MVAAMRVRKTGRASRSSTRNPSAAPAPCVAAARSQRSIRTRRSGANRTAAAPASSPAPVPRPARYRSWLMAWRGVPPSSPAGSERRVEARRTFADGRSAIFRSQMLRNGGQHRGVERLAVDDRRFGPRLPWGEGDAARSAERLAPTSHAGSETGSGARPALAQARPEKAVSSSVWKM